jgi:bifunctional DNA-binding transcriptional regulator/antitoxin component of YhaV-PrlF toxin-antitoxin module
MEIEICRIDNFALKSIGVEEGDKVIIETPNRRLSIRALILEEELKNSRKEELIKIEGKDGAEKFASNLNPQLDLHKFNYIPKFKSSNHDLSWIFIDYDARVKLGIKLGDPVMVYRDNKFAISKRIESITIPLLLAFFGVGLNFRRINNYLQLSEELTLALEISFYVLIPLFIIWINLAPLRKSH